MRYALTSMPAAQSINRSLVVMRGTSQETNRQSKKREAQRDRDEFWDTEQPELRVRALRERHRDGQEQHLAGPRQQRDADRDRRSARRDTSWHEQIHEPGQVQQLLHGRGPFDKREIGSGVLEDHRLVEHRQFEMRGGVLGRDASRLGDYDNEEAR